MREKRRFIRFNIALKVAYIVRREPKIEKFGTTRDISAQGMQLLTSDKIKPGDKLDLKIFLPEALNPAHIRGVAVWSKEPEAAKSHSYNAGIDFEKIEEDNKNTFLKFLCGLMRIFIAILTVGSLLMSGCATMYNPATEKKELVFITTPMEVMLGRNTAMQAAKQYSFVKDPKQADKVTEIGEKLAKVSDRTDLKYHFAVVEDKEINAFTMPGGYIYVNSGLLDITNNDDELACVIGHEIGHVAARHIAKKLQVQLGYDILMNIALRNASVRQMRQAIDVSFNLAELGYSREDELLADRLGAKYAYKAGYDPRAMITFLKKLKEKDKGEMGPVFLRSHPYASQRIQMLEKQIPSIMSKIDAKSGRDVQGLSAKSAQPTRVMCGKCRRIFPGTVKYCPYDGTKLGP